MKQMEGWTAPRWVHHLAISAFAFISMNCQGALLSSPGIAVHSSQGQALMLEYSIDSSKFPVLNRMGARIQVASPRLYSEARLDRIHALERAGLVVTPQIDGEIRIAVTTAEAIRMPIFDLLLSASSIDPEQGIAVETLLSELVVVLPPPELASPAKELPAKDMTDSGSTPPPAPPPKNGKRHIGKMLRPDRPDIQEEHKDLKFASIPLEQESKALALLSAWARAWQQGDSDAYLAAYASNYKPSGHASTEQWRSDRMEKLAKSKHIEIRIKAMHFLPDTSEIVVRLHQCFVSANYRSSTIKDIVLHDDAGNLSIIREKIIDERAEKSKRRRTLKRSPEFELAC